MIFRVGGGIVRIGVARDGVHADRAVSECTGGERFGVGGGREGRVVVV